MIRPILIALQFLTTLPVRYRGAPTDEEIGRSLTFYPLIGLVLGLFLAAGAWLLQRQPPLLVAALLLLAWTALTGALHLDGLADCADAWVGGRGDRVRTLAIMKDPYSGPVGVAAVVIVLLLKFAALTVLCGNRAFLLLTVAPVLGRAAIQGLFLTTPYVRPQGLGAALVAQMRRGETFLVLCLTCALVWLAWERTGLAALLVAGGGLVLFRRAMMRRIGGTTGDTAGALVELVEVSVLVACGLIRAM